MNRSYYGWLAGSTLSVLGDTALFFALGWAATGIGPRVAALVLTGFTLPRAVLLLLGGVLGDRIGPRRLLLACTAIVGCCCFLLAVAVGLRGVSAGLLLTTSVVVGTVDAFALPAAGVLPRLFVPDDQLPRAMALRTSATQVITLAGGPLSGLLVATVGLVGALTLDGLTFAVQFAVLLLLKPPYDVHPQRDRPSVLKDAVDGLRVAVGDPVLRMILAVVALVAAFVLPVTSLCVPLLARSQGWEAKQAGFVVAGSVAGGLLVTVLVARFGTFSRADLTAGVGCLVAALGIAALALAPTVPTAIAATLTQGVGIGLFTSHLAPLFIRSTPKSHLTRLQSLLSLAQTVPLIASTNLLATLTIHQALTLTATTTTLAGLILLKLATSASHPAGGPARTQNPQI
ncbi:MFS transporter [Kribbella sindirgiensis]|uniref:MFS transporter n=1 Tax=Kribbella sindirgiensis TaxID=1124744 RepID=A0A4V2M6C8_9ACTN|nr:MFS transporter [Kribbella sindirgiensis]TCC43202.1 MFS transporter [Kribbella sindirgiensis]